MPAELVAIPVLFVLMSLTLVEIFAAFPSMAKITEVRLTVLPPDPDPDAAAVDTAVIV
jgi:hypothetical protein